VTYREAPISVAALAGLLLLGVVLAPVGTAHAQDLPDGFEQILPRGRIASIDDPQWVYVDDAELPGDAIVLGVLIEGHPRAMSINLLNAHEVVNDAIGDTAYAAVW